MGFFADEKLQLLYFIHTHQFQLKPILELSKYDELFLTQTNI